MPSIDFKDAYFVIPTASEHREFHRFFSEGKLYQLCCLPFGLSTAPTVFTKLMRPSMSDLRRMGHESEDYINVIWICG